MRNKEQLEICNEVKLGAYTHGSGAYLCPNGTLINLWWEKTQ